MKIKGKLKEAIAVAAVMLGVVILQSDLWISAKRMFSHDSIIWFGVFSYFVDCLQHGILPLWNPYMNCGEIFFLNMHVLHLWDPSTLFLVFAGKFLKVDTLTVYHYDLLFRYLIFICGSYFFFRRVAKYKFSAFLAFIALSFSTLCSSYLKQHAFILSFYLLPWILLYTFKFLEEESPLSLIWLAFLWGVAFSSYQAMYLISSVSVLLVCIFISRGFDFSKKRYFLNFRKSGLAAFLVFLLLSINLLPVFLNYTFNTIPTVRILVAPLGARSFPDDFFNLFAPYSFMLHFEMLHFGSVLMSESFLYIGLIPLFLAIVGLFYSRQRYRLGFSLALGIITLLMLGPGFYVFKLFTDFLPFFSIIRNTHTFGTFFIFCLAYFACLGMDVLLELMKNEKLGSYKRQFILILSFIGVTACLINHHVLRVYPPPLWTFPGIYRVLSSIVGQDFSAALKEIFIRSYYNAILFVFSAVIIFFIIKKPRISRGLKYVTIVAFMLADLLLLNLALNKFTTIPREDMSLWPQEELSYSNYREELIWPKYPFFGFAAAMQKKFTALSIEIPWVTTHFYEMKDFFHFADNSQITMDVKNDLMGITAPKLKLAGGAVVLPLYLQARELGRLSRDALSNVVFIEEDPPEKFLKLKINPQKIKDANIAGGTIKVLRFDPNSILLEVIPQQDSFLYYSDGFDRSWRAFIDGKESKVYRTSMAFKSVIVEKGKHIVSFVYDPKLYKVTLILYFAGIFVAVIMLIYFKNVR